MQVSATHQCFLVETLCWFTPELICQLCFISLSIADIKQLLKSSSPCLQGLLFKYTLS